MNSESINFFFIFLGIFRYTNLALEKGRQFYGWVNWTVAETTPNVVYYQSYKEYGMGWKIHVLDEGQEPSSVPDKHCQKNHAFMAFLLTICLHAYFIS